MLVRKIKKADGECPPNTPGDTLALHKTDYWQRCAEFIQGARSYQYSVPQFRTYLSQEYAKVFPNKPYPVGQPMNLVSIAISYELMVQGYKSVGLAIPLKVKQNHQAAIAFLPDNLDPILQGLMKQQIKSQGENETMKTKDKVPVKKAPKASPEMKAKAGVKAKTEAENKISVGGRYAEIFESGKKITDQEIAALIKKEFNKEHSVNKVGAYRAGYNRGSLPGQKGKPKTQSLPYEAAKAKVKVKVRPAAPAPTPVEPETAAE